MSEEQIEEILKHMCKFKNEPYTHTPCDKCVLNNSCHYQTIAKELQNSDIVKVIRCNDCKEWRRHVGRVNSPNGHCFCHDTDTNGFDFCSYGERKL